jgi:hypothetical protein
MKFAFILFILAALIVITCDQGLSPEEELDQMSTVSGTVYFQHWPPLDSLYDYRLVLFPTYPGSDIISEIISGRAVLYPELADPNRLPFYVDSLNYQIKLNAGLYEYFAVAHQYGDSLFHDWQVVGHYDTTLQDLLPTAIEVEAGQLLKGINIFADFDSVLLRP